MLRAVPHPILVSRLLRILRHHQTQAHQERHHCFSSTIVLVDFDNRTGDPIFDETQKQGTGGRAGSIATLNVVPDQEMGEALTLMGRNPRQKAYREVAREVCHRVGRMACATPWQSGSVSEFDSEIRAISFDSAMGAIQFRAVTPLASFFIRLRHVFAGTVSRFSDGPPSRNHPQRGRTTHHRRPR